MISLEEVAYDPDFAQSFEVIRTSTAFVRGGQATTSKTVPMYGIIKPAGEKDLQIVPQGDRQMGSILIITTFDQVLYTTQRNPNELSDVVLWNNERYRVISIRPDQDFGFRKAIGVRLSV